MRPQVLFDTGSATMWVPSTQCNYSCMGKDVFNSSDSRTFVKVRRDCSQGE